MEAPHQNKEKDMTSLKIVPTSSAQIVRDIEQSAKQSLFGRIIEKPKDLNDLKLHNHRMVTVGLLTAFCFLFLISVYLLVSKKDLQIENKNLQITNKHLSITVDDAMIQNMRLNRENKNLTDEVRDYKYVAVPHLKNELDILSKEVNKKNKQIRVLRANLRAVCDTINGEKPQTCPKSVHKKVAMIKPKVTKKKEDPTKFTASYPLRIQNGL